MKQKMTAIIATFALMMHMIVGMTVSYAQTADAQVLFNLDLSILLEGQEHPQSDYVFEILERDAGGQPVEDGQVYRYDVNDPNHMSEIMLSPGNYTFRLYDGAETPFNRNGQDLQVKTSQVIVGSNSPVETSDMGQVMDWGNGIKVLDLNFEVTSEDVASTNNSFTLKVELADSSSLSDSGTVMEETTEEETTVGETTEEETTVGETTEEETTVEETTEEETTVEETTEEETTIEETTIAETTFEDTSVENSEIELPLIVTDQDGNPVEQVTIDVNDSQVVTDAEGKATANVEAGSVMMSITAVPEGYQGVTEFETFAVDGPVEPIQISVNKLDEVHTVQFTAQTEDGQAVPGVGITLVDQEVITDETGVAIFEEVPQGIQNYTVTSQPEGYSIEVIDGQIDVIDDSVNETLVFMADETTVEETTEAETTVEETTEETTVEKTTEAETTVEETTEAETTVEETTEAETTEEETTVEPKGRATLTFVDKAGNGIEGLGITLGDNEYISDASGNIVLPDLPINEYSYQITTVPEGYQAPEDSSIVLNAKNEYLETITVEEKLKLGNFTFQLKDNQNKVVKNAKVQIDNQVVTTDDKGQAIFTNLPVGEKEVKLVEVPKDYEIDQDTQSIVVKEGQNNTVQLKVKRIEETTQAETTMTETTVKDNKVVVDVSEIQQEKISPEEEQRIAAEAKQATRQFKDPQTGIEVWVNPQDAGKAETIKVSKLENNQQLVNYDADIYDIQLIDKNQQAVQLTKIAEVKIPTRPVNSQIQVVRQDGRLSRLTFALQNNHVSFRTQKLGTFAITYRQRDKVAEETTKQVLVEKTTGVEKNLPGTGEAMNLLPYVLGLILLALGGWLIYTKKRHK